MAEVLKGILPNPTARKAVDKLAAAVVLLESKIAAATPPLEDLQDSSVGFLMSLVCQHQRADHFYRSRTTPFRSRTRRL